MTIPTYFSHSYRLEDQKLNETFWHLFSTAKFSFFVDPPSDTTIHTHLERMMNCCSAFVAVVNQRLEVDRFFCSRFILYEYGLSIQARRPRLLLIDSRVPDEPFADLADHEVHFFSHDRPLEEQAELKRKIQRLRRVAKTFPNRRGKRRGTIALMVPSGGQRSAYADATTQARIKEAAGLYGFRIAVREVPHERYEHNAFFALDLDGHEALILDVRGTELPEWVFAYAYGRLIPTIKLVQVPSTETPADVALPDLVKGLRMDEDEPGVESVTYWRDVDDLIWQLRNAFKKLNEDQIAFKDGPEGEVYFESIGRRPARIFISNAGNANPLARRLSHELRLRGLQTFQYKDPAAIASGSDWEDKIRHEAQVCDLFVALIGPGYEASRWCMEELNIARARLPQLELLSFMVEKTSLAFIGRRQTPELPTDEAAAVRLVLGDIYDRLTAGGRGHNLGRGRTTLLGASQESIIDAIRQLAPTDWPAFRARMQAVGVEVGPGQPAAPFRPRGAAEAIFTSAGRADAETNATLTLVTTLADLTLPKHEAALRKIASRLAGGRGVDGA
jgi:hypothetical protein